MPIEATYLDKFLVKNLTGRTITLGDLVNVSISPGNTIDLLKQPRVNKEKINQSHDLKMAVKQGRLQIIKPFPQGQTEDEKTQILADERSSSSSSNETPDGEIFRSGNLVSEIVLSDGITWTISRDLQSRISSITNGTKTWTFTRNIEGQIESWTVS